MTISSTIVGSLACQRNSFLKEFSASVISCNELKSVGDKDNFRRKGTEVNSGGDKTKFAIELSDTVLFPEGGGQPYDTGLLLLPDNTRISVEQVLRDKLKALHITDTPIAPNTQVTMEVDWGRRFDIMQQHTGQHLLSAVFDTYDLDTLSWSMGDEINYIELPKKVDEKTITEVSDKVNELINENIPIKVVTPDEHGEDIDTSKIPKDYNLSQGIVRIVKIGSIDSNPCCGTHLTSTGQIQAISLLHQNSIRGGNSRLHFICGSRVPKYLEKLYGILKTVSGLQLSCQIEEVTDKTAVLNQNYRKALSRESNLLKEVAEIHAQDLFEKFKQNSRRFDFIYREDNSSDYVTYFQKEMSNLIKSDQEAGVNLESGNTIVIINGNYASGNGGTVKSMGPKSPIVQEELKKIITSLKGGGKGSSFQGKIVKYEKGELQAALKSLEKLRDESLSQQ